MMAKVLMIDGLLYGQVRDVDDARVLCFLDYEAADPGADIPVGTYYVYKYVIAGRVLLLGSTSYGPPEQLAHDVFWDLLASDKAREVAQVVERAPAVGAEDGTR